MRELLCQSLRPSQHPHTSPFVSLFRFDLLPFLSPERERRHTRLQQAQPPSATLTWGDEAALLLQQQQLSPAAKARRGAAQAGKGSTGSSSTAVGVRMSKRLRSRKESDGEDSPSGSRLSHMDAAAATAGAGPAAVAFGASPQSKNSSIEMRHDRPISQARALCSPSHSAATATVTAATASITPVTAVEMKRVWWFGFPVARGFESEKVFRV